MNCPHCGEGLGLNNICINPSCSYFGTVINLPDSSTSNRIQDNRTDNIDNYKTANTQANFDVNNNTSNDNHINRSNNMYNNSYSNNISIEEFAAFIGEKNTNYYLKYFDKRKNTNYFSSWNWPCFFLTYYWLLYRKLYLHAAILIPVTFILSRVLGKKSFILIAFVIRILLSIFANAIYLNNAERKIKSIKAAASGLNASQYINKLRQKGGVSIVAPLILLGIYIIFVVIAFTVFLFSVAHSTRIISPNHYF